MSFDSYVIAFACKMINMGRVLHVYAHECNLYPCEPLIKEIYIINILFWSKISFEKCWLLWVFPLKL